MVGDQGPREEGKGQKEMERKRERAERASGGRKRCRRHAVTSREDAAEGGASKRAREKEREGDGNGKGGEGQSQKEGEKKRKTACSMRERGR